MSSKRPKTTTAAPPVTAPAAAVTTVPPPPPPARVADPIRTTTPARTTDPMLLAVEALSARLAAIEAKLDRVETQRAPDRDAILHQVNYTNHNLYLHLKEAMRVRELHHRDLMVVLDRITGWIPPRDLVIETTHPVALDTDDHKIPWGTKQDNTRSPRFAARCEELFNRPLTYLDLGCAGGGLALDFILRGHRGYGVEGSDFSLKAQRAEWRLLKDQLFTADITKPFRLKGVGGAVLACDVITAWEVIEHIADADLPALVENILAHLKPDGIVAGSIAVVPDNHPNGARYHRTVKDQAWWTKRFAELGLPFVTDHPFAFYDFARGTQNGPIDQDYSIEPHGFHFVARRA